MGAQMRVYRQRIRTVQATKKITRAMVHRGLARGEGAAARQGVLLVCPRDHPRGVGCGHAIRRRPPARPRSTRTCAGQRWPSSPPTVVWRRLRLVGHQGERAPQWRNLRDEGKEVVPYLVGRKAVGFYRFRKREYAAEWSGSTDQPNFEVAREIAERVVPDFTKDHEEGGVDEFHVVFTRFVNMVTQVPEVIRMLPLEVVEGEEARPRRTCSRCTSSSRGRGRPRRFAAEVRLLAAVQLPAPGCRLRAWPRARRP